MRGGDRLLKLLFSTLTTLLVISPIIYGLYIYDWDIEALTTPTYEPPKIDFELTLNEYSLQNKTLYIRGLITNSGEIDVEILELKGYLTDLEGQKYGNISLEEDIYLKAQEQREFIIKIEFESESIARLVKTVIESDNNIFKIEGRFTLTVLSSKVIAPFTYQIGLNKDNLNIDPSDIQVTIENIQIIESEIKIEVLIYNPTFIPIKIVGMNLDLYTSNEELITTFTLEKTITINQNTENTIILTSTLTREAISLLIDKEGELTTLLLVGTLEIEIFGYRFEITVREYVNEGAST